MMRAQHNKTQSYECRPVVLPDVRRRLHVGQDDTAVTLTPNLARKYQENRQAGSYGKHERMHTEIEGRSKIVQRRVSVNVCNVEYDVING
jgi:hypothetical protein